MVRGSCASFGAICLKPVATHPRFFPLGPARFHSLDHVWTMAGRNREDVQLGSEVKSHPPWPEVKPSKI